MRIIKVFDNGGKSFDRYTVVFDEVVRTYMVDEGFRNLNFAFGLSHNPGHPQGFSQCAEVDIKHIEEDKTNKSIKFSDLPKNVQKHVRKRMEEE